MIVLTIEESEMLLAAVALDSQIGLPVGTGLIVHGAYFNSDKPVEVEVLEWVGDIKVGTATIIVVRVTIPYPHNMYPNRYTYHSEYYNFVASAIIRVVSLPDNITIQDVLTKNVRLG